MLNISRGDAVPQLHNWGWSESFRPLVMVTPTSATDVARLVTNTQDFPSPVRPLGGLRFLDERRFFYIWLNLTLTLWPQAQSIASPRVFATKEGRSST